MWGPDRRASPCTCALTRMVGATEQLLQLLPWVNQDSHKVAGKGEKGSRDIDLGAPFKQDQRLSGAML